MSEIRSNPEEEKQFIATTYIDLVRHGSRFGGSMQITFYDGTKIKFDDLTDLTPSGKARSIAFGETSYPEEVALVHPRGGDMSRHGETGEDLLSGSRKFGGRETPAPILKKDRVKGSRRGEGVDYAGAGLSSYLKTYRELTNRELDRIVSELSAEEQEKLKQDPELRAKYREQAQVVGLGEALKNDNIVDIAARNEAYELMHVIELSRRGVKAGETKAIPIVGSGLFGESLLKRSLVVEDLASGERKLGFNNIQEIGGFTKQATAIRLKLERDERAGDPRVIDDFLKDTHVEIEFTDPERAKLFEGKRVSLDWKKIRELAEAKKGTMRIIRKN